MKTLLEVPGAFFYFFFFAFGAIIGSFLNVVIYRVPRRKSIIFPKSSCPECKVPIKPYDNIPLLSWLVLKGKCRSCKKPISARYFIVELLTAILFTITFWKFGLSFFLPVALCFICAVIALIFIDAEHMILPNAITYPMFFFAIIIRLVFAFLFGKSFFTDLNYFPSTKMENYPIWFVTLVSAVFGAIIGGGFLWVTGKLWEILRKIEAMGMGDVKMMTAIGAFLGWRLTLLNIFIGALTGTLAGVVIAARGGSLQTQIPFGIFLGIGFIVSLLFGEEIIKAYLLLVMP